MSGFIKRMFLSENWKRVFAWVCVWGYAYDVIIWPLVFWITTLLTEFTSRQWPAPPLVPWEQLAVMTANLAVIGSVQLFREREANRAGEERKPGAF
jgi:hypothetical protein